MSAVCFCLGIAPGVQSGSLRLSLFNCSSSIFSWRKELGADEPLILIGSVAFWNDTGQKRWFFKKTFGHDCHISTSIACNCVTETDLLKGKRHTTINSISYLDEVTFSGPQNWTEVLNGKKKNPKKTNQIKISSVKSVKNICNYLLLN